MNRECDAMTNYTITLRLYKMIRELEKKVIRYSDEKREYLEYIRNNPEGKYADMCELSVEACECELEVNLKLIEMLKDIYDRHRRYYFIEENR